MIRAMVIKDCDDNQVYTDKNLDDAENWKCLSR